MHVIYDLDIPTYLMPPLATNTVDGGDKMALCLFYNMTYHPKSFLKTWHSYSQRHHKSNQVAVTRKQRHDREKHTTKNREHHLLPVVWTVWEDLSEKEGRQSKLFAEGGGEHKLKHGLVLADVWSRLSSLQDSGRACSTTIFMLILTMQYIFYVHYVQ